MRACVRVGVNADVYVSHSYAVRQPLANPLWEGEGEGGQWHREITSERGRTVFEGEVMFVVFLNIL